MCLKFGVPVTPPPSRFTRQPQKEKNVPCSFDFRGGGFFLKWKGHFSFWGSARKDILAVWRGFNSDSVLRKLFSGDMDFLKHQTNLFLDFARAEEGAGEESARACIKRKFVV